LQPLIGIRDGAFCPQCECPVHMECAQKDKPDVLGHCPRCGSINKVAKKWRNYEDAADRERAWDAKRIAITASFPILLLIGFRLLGFFVVVPLAILALCVIGYWFLVKTGLKRNENSP
jgi:hypothetical protein